MQRDTSEQEVKNAKAKAGRDARVDAIVWRSLLQHADGRKFIWRMADDAGMFASSFGLGGFDPIRSAWYDGRADLFRRHWNIIQLADPKAFLVMLQENAPAGAEIKENEDGRSDSSN